MFGLYETGLTDSCEHIELYNGIAEGVLNPFKLVPNPAHNFVEIRMEQGVPERVLLLDVQGRLIFETDNHVINLRPFESGVYWVRILSNGKWTQNRFVKN